jgi:DmsE family decaheme c-type cytochrome
MLSFFFVELMRIRWRRPLGLLGAAALLAIGVFGSRSVLAAGAAQQTVAQPAGESASAGYVGESTCTRCHTDIAKGFAGNPHSRLALEHAGRGVTCESCHGPGKAHVEGGGDVTKIFRFEKASAEQIDAKCLTCHAAAHPDFLRSSHGEAGLTCLSCHSVHHAATPNFLLTAAQPTLCYRCHASVKVRFSMPFHHRVPEGLMKCTDCHDPHGTFHPDQLQATADQNLICTKCHTETAGPFVYEHPVVRTEGCLACHSPHGSPNARLLKISNVNTLCLQCHTASMNFGEAGTPSFHNQATQYVACTNCHTQIHGSNASDVFFK